MTSEHVDTTVGAGRSETSDGITPELRALDPDAQAPAIESRAHLAHVMRPVSAVATPVSGVMTVARMSVSVTRKGLRQIVARMPGTLDATRASAHEASSALQSLPDPTLRTLAASSVGLGAGLYLAGAPRAFLLAGAVPAVVMSAVIALRPIEPLAPVEVGE